MAAGRLILAVLVPVERLPASLERDRTTDDVFVELAGELAETADGEVKSLIDVSFIAELLAAPQAADCHPQSHAAPTNASTIAKEP